MVDRIINVSIDDADLRWRVAMALSAAMPLAYVALFPCFPESPRYLVAPRVEKKSVLDPRPMSHAQ